MKQRTKIIFLAYSAMVIFMSSACIYMSHMIKSRYQDTSSEINIYKNVYVTNIEDNMITANMYGNIKKFNSGKIAEDVTGCLCDITVENGKIVGVNTKTDVVSGKVLSVSQDSVEIEGYGSVKLDEDFIMYEKENSLISNYSSIIVGYALQDFIVADGEVCGAIKNKPLQADNIRVIIKTSGFRDIFFNEAVFCADSGMIVETGEESYETAPGETVVFNPDTEDFNEGRIKLIPKSGEIQFQSVNRGIGTPSYGGTIEVSLYDEGIVVVNEVGIEDYLKKVVPSEMPSGFNLEALKCQAVCARSYAYTELSNNYYSAYGAHIDDSIQFQVYNNSQRAESTDTAVDETAGQVLSYNGEVVKTYYYSTSCGSTTDVTLWGNTTENYPYFVAECVGGVDRGLTLTVESEFNTFIKGENEADYDYDCTLYRWSMEESVKEISEGFARSTGNNVGNITDIEVLERVNGGAAVKVKVTGDKGETVIDSESAIRAAFGNANVDMNTKSGTTKYANLPSTFCVFEKVTEGKKLTGFKITGGGYGHGIGMSQNAANKMAESMTYAQILEFFYRGTTLTLISSQDNV
jgi:stage II sporulation protein D|uniref:SpoIID/LytB domain-containing protein n=1 Tax=Lachnospira eligens TaxID=39485 RepID=UPI003FEFBC98